VVALCLAENERDVIACVQAGIAGYVTDQSSLEELTQRIREAAAGDFSCPPHIAAGLVRRLAMVSGLSEHGSGWRRLTPRELDVAGLLEQGMSNQQIATRLTIQLATVKNHVHNILDKLDASCRADAVVALRSRGLVTSTW
jgi:DNA-binding NarL/FixJ family response regulator